MTNKDLNKLWLNTKYGYISTDGVKATEIDPKVYPTVKWDSWGDLEYRSNAMSASELMTRDELENLLSKRLTEFVNKNVKNAVTTNKSETKKEEKKENNMSNITGTINTIKNVLFLAPGYNYAKSVVTNQSKELDRKKIPYNASIEPDNFYIHTDKVHIEVVYMDPIKWTAALFQKRDAVFGKKELVDKACEHFFHTVIAPKKSLSKYIRDIHTDPYREEPVKPRETYIPEIKNAYFNNPMTVVLWEDGTKTMVRCQEGDVYSAETGLALCIAKKAMGNMPNFNNVFKKWIPEELQDNRIVLKVEGVNFAEAVKDVDFLSKFRDGIQRAFGLEEV